MTTKTTSFKDVQNDVKESTHKIWLAGLGALSTVEEEGSRLFQQLVDRGRDVESRGKEQVDKARSEVRSQLERAKVSLKQAKGRVEAGVDDAWDRIDERIAEVMHRVGVPTRDEVQTLTRRVEELNRKIDQLRTPAGGTAPAAAAEPARKVYHVSTHDEGWKVQAEGATRATSVHPTKEAAVQAARDLAQGQAPSQVIVHRMDGTIQTQYTYDAELAN